MLSIISASINATAGMAWGSTQTNLRRRSSSGGRDSQNRHTSIACVGHPFQTAHIGKFRVINDDTDIVYAVYQGIVFSHLLHQDKILALGDRTDCIRFTGGPTHSAIWMQMFCDASNLPLEIVDIQQSGCRAAALCAAVGSGYYSGFEQAILASPPPITHRLPNAEKHRMLRERFDKFKRLADALSAVM